MQAAAKHAKMMYMSRRNNATLSKAARVRKERRKQARINISLILCEIQTLFALAVT